MGDLDTWMDEQYLQQLWSTKGENVLIKLIRDKRTGNSLGYAFIGFTSSIAAQRALATVHGTKMPNSQRPFRLNWASGGGILDKKEDRAPEYSLFVGDLSSDVDETYLLAMFRQRYASCHSAKVMTDPVSGLSRGYGFVRFHDQFEQQNALVEMNGVYCGHRPIRISLATPKGGGTSGPLTTAPLSSTSSSSSSTNNGHQQHYQQQPTHNQNTIHQQQQNQHHARYYQLALQAPALVQQPTDPSNTTVFVGGLSTPLNEEELRQYFIPFGEVTYVKIPPGKGCGFVQYVSRQSAEMAIERMNGFQIGQSRIRLSWGRSHNDKGNTGGMSAQQSSTSYHFHQQQQQQPYPTSSSSVLLLKQQQQQYQHQLQMQHSNTPPPPSSLMDHPLDTSFYMTPSLSSGHPASNINQHQSHYHPITSNSAIPNDTTNLPPFIRYVWE
ncbi:hypothetical protein BC941DRAFT_345782 [Chlamydoabsidia padenii]|nr:hypothetical protein BC941DRAFT_345782 [Chlamydoabsidia padenii]